MENIQQKQKFSKAELKRANEALDKIFPPYEKMSDEEKWECDQLIKWNQTIF